MVLFSVLALVLAWASLPLALAQSLTPVIQSSPSSPFDPCPVRCVGENLVVAGRGRYGWLPYVVVGHQATTTTTKL